LGEKRELGILMRVIDYLQAKYRQKFPTTCLFAEASILGIPYPLQPAWLVRFGNNEITPEQSNKIRHRLTNSLGRPNKSQEWAESGLKALARASVIEISAKLYNQFDKYSTPEWRRAVAAVFALNKNCCSHCGAQTRDLTVKHLQDVPALFLDYDNLVPICGACIVKSKNGHHKSDTER
jgi:hypothetical protein